MSHTRNQNDDPVRLLEEELLAMLPAEPSDGLRHRVHHALLEANTAAAAEPAPQPSKPASAWNGWLPLAAAAAVAVLAVVFFPPPASSPGNSPVAANAPVSQPVAGETLAMETAAPALQPLSSNSQLQRVDYEGILREDNTPYRQIRSRYLEKRVFRDPAADSTVEVLVPREEVRLVPVITN